MKNKKVSCWKFYKSTKQHYIHLDENAKPTRKMQHRLNPNMKEGVRIEVLKLLDVCIIYPISNSSWVSPVQLSLKSQESQ